MAGLLDRYGIKEVADVTFYKINDNGLPTYPVLFLDTLKVSTIEQTADESTANGGKGNPPLVIWDYNKDITVTLEDALFSAKSLAIMFGDGTLKDFKDGEALIMKTEVFTANGTTLPTEGNSVSNWKAKYTGPNGKLYTKLNPKFYSAEGEVVDALVSGQKYFCTFDLAVDGKVIDVSANTFPGTYYVTGDTYARSDISGDDEFFQFIIPKAKVQSENTITLEADGDPSTFNMSLHVMRPEDGVMMKLVKYNAIGGDNADVNNETTVYHNHYLQTETTPKTIPAPENNDLRIKTLPARAAYAVDTSIDDDAEATEGLELEKYNATQDKWEDATGTIKVYNENNTTEYDFSTAIASASTKVRFGIGSDTTHLTKAISYKIKNA